MSSNLFGKAQKLGKALMLPIAVLPAAAILLRLGQADIYHSIAPFVTFMDLKQGIPFISAAGGAIFDNLPLLFAIGVAIGLSFDGAGAAGLAGAVAYYTLTKAVVAINPSINMGVLAGMITGIVAGLLYNKFYNIKLPDFLGFFGGKRFVPIVSSFAGLGLAVVFGFTWPPIQTAIQAVGNWIISAGTIGTFIYGVLNRLLIPLGLHHILNNLVWFVFGTFTGTNGMAVTGDLNRFFAGDPTAGVFMAGFFPIMMFALPAACLAMYTAAPKGNRTMAGGILFSMAFTSLLTGITEPIEFSFMFISPMLYLFHSLMMGASLALCEMLNIHHGFGFSGGAIDYFLNLSLSTNGWSIIPLGIAFGAIYYFVFLIVIKTRDLPTPGRMLASETTVSEAPPVANDISALAAAYLEGLGGAENVDKLDACITRLRLNVLDEKKVDDSNLTRSGATGVIRSGKDIQVVIGTKAELIATEMKRLAKR